MRRGGRFAVALGVALLLAYLGYRLYGHSSTLLRPAVITPRMNVHRALSPRFDARVDRLLHESADDRRDRRRLIALTFDDGPYPVATPLLLDVLRELHVRATFFVIARDAEQYPELTKRIARDGHEIANHTYSHPNLDQLPPRAVSKELTRARAVLGRLVHDPAVKTLFRPPHGRYTEETADVVVGLGYHFVLWTDDAGDWRAMRPAELAHHLERYATAPEIALLHNGALATIVVLPEVVRRFRAAGYRFVTVGTLLRSTPAEQINHPARHGV